MGAGVGLFITLIALKSSYIIKADPDTLLTIQTFSGPTFHTAGISAVLALTGVLLTAYLMHRKVMGALLFGILGTWILGIICELTGLYHVQEGFPSLLPHFNLNAFTQPFHSFCDLFGSAFDVEQWHHKSSGNSGWNLLFSVDFMIICFAFLFTDFFDTIGTTSGAVANTPLMKENGDIPRLNKILLADSAATFSVVFWEQAPPQLLPNQQ